MHKMNSYEKPYVLRYMVAFIAGGAVGMSATVLVSYLFQRVGWGGMSTGVLCIPWIVCGAILIPAAVHKGVMLERERQSKTEK
ncbi:MAG: hypothetical protein JW849_05055 [Phycisphaerae bacterium]|nr:hypothetical protein [Phycisphaerae bacterium]